MTPTVSVCVPVYNGGPFIDETVRSVLAQTHSEIELILVDNRSSDDSLARMRRWAAKDARVRVIAPPDHVSAVENFQRATGACAGKYIKLVCADDTLAPRCLELQVAALEAHASAVLAASRRAIVDERGKVMLSSHGLRSLCGLVRGPDVIARCIRSGTNQLGEPAAVLIRRSALEQSGTWSGAWPYMTDLELWFRLLRRGDLIAIEEPLATFRVQPTSWSATMGSSQAEQARRLFRRELNCGAGTVTSRDVVIGGIKAQMLQYGRRAVYLWRNLAGRRGVRLSEPRAFPHT